MAVLNEGSRELGGRGSTAAFALAVVLASCGGFSNQPFKTGAIRGSIAGADPGVALVTILGTDRQTTPSADGTFELAEVAVGAVELHVVASSTRASRIPVVLQPGQVSELGEIRPDAAAFLRVKVRTPDHQLPRGTASVAGTHYQGVALSASGEARLGPLGAGCWTVEADVPGLGKAASQRCAAAGEEQTLEIALSETEDACTVTGCEPGTRCAPDGRCVFCLDPRDCPMGLACASDGRCLGTLPPCSTCRGEWECGGRRCEALPAGGDPVCIDECDTSHPCFQGFSCEPQAHVCVPVASIGSCPGLRSLGSTCQLDENCDALAEGLCVGSRCTVDCTGPAGCPPGFDCAFDAGRMVCKPR